jgi:hypothetical protein
MFERPRDGRLQTRPPEEATRILPRQVEPDPILRRAQALEDVQRLVLAAKTLEDFNEAMNARVSQGELSPQEERGLVLKFEILTNKQTKERPRADLFNRLISALDATSYYKILSQLAEVTLTPTEIDAIRWKNRLMEGREQTTALPSETRKEAMRLLEKIGKEE